MVLLIEHDVEGVVTRAAKAHKKNLLVSTEASALLRMLGMDPISSDTSAPSASELTPPPPPPDGAVVMIGAVTKASVKYSASAKKESRPVQLFKLRYGLCFKSEAPKQLQEGWLTGGTSQSCRYLLLFAEQCIALVLRIV